MSFKQPPALHELQYDALGASIVDNPYLPASPIPSKNKVLNTSKPYVTGAINELLQTIENIRNLVQTSLSQQQAVLGDFIADPTLLRDLQKIDTSVLKAIIKLSKEIEGDSNNPPDISAIAPSIKEAILKLSATMTQPESAYEIWLELGNTGTKEDFLNSLKGADGQYSLLQGPAGAAATIEIGEVITGETGTLAAVQNVGTDTAARLNFTIPRGEKGLVGDVNLPGPLDDETITCDIDKLQEEIDKLPRFLNKNVTINVNPGTIDKGIRVSRFFGYGALTINGSSDINTTHNLLCIQVDCCHNTQINISGFNLTFDGNSTTIAACILTLSNNATCQFACMNMTNGDKANTNNRGLWAGSNVNFHTSNISNKGTAIRQQFWHGWYSNVTGSNNDIVFVSCYGAIISKIYGNTITGRIIDNYWYAGTIS
jgi:hypothetical protein